MSDDEISWPDGEALRRCVADLESLIAPRSVVLIGEVPGINEGPALIDRLVGRAVDTGLDVVVGLEIPMTEDLLSSEPGPFFERRPEFQDGRSSRAMSSLVRCLRKRRNALAGPQRLELVAMDGPWVAPGSPIPLAQLGVLEQPRNEVMASNLLGVMDGLPRAITIVLAGPMHTQVVPTRSGGGPPERTLGQILAVWHPATLALRLIPAGGQAWVLDPTAGGRTVELPMVDTPFGAIWATEPGADGHHGVVHLGSVTASGPTTS